MIHDEEPAVQNVAKGKTKEKNEKKMTPKTKNDNCRGCTNNHIKKSFPSKNYYVVEELSECHISERYRKEHATKIKKE